jgi:hypothetical protein
MVSLSLKVPETALSRQTACIWSILYEDIFYLHILG